MRGHGSHLVHVGTGPLTIDPSCVALEAAAPEPYGPFPACSAFRQRPTWQHPGHGAARTIATELDRSHPHDHARPSRPPQRLHRADAAGAVRRLRPRSTPTPRCGWSSSPVAGGASAPAPTSASAATPSTSRPAARPPARADRAAAPRRGRARSPCGSTQCTKPVIAAINGPAVGVGATMTLPMDIRLASETARFGFVFARRGIVPEACSSWFLPAGRRHQHGARVDDDRPGVRRRRRRSTADSCDRPRPRRPAPGRLRAGRARSPTNTSAVSVAHDPPDAVAHARRGPPDGGPPGRLAGHRQPRPVRRRPRGRHVVPREAPAAVHRPGARRHPPVWPFWEDPGSESVARPAASPRTRARRRPADCSRSGRRAALQARAPQSSAPAPSPGCG